MKCKARERTARGRARMFALSVGLLLVALCVPEAIRSQDQAPAAEAGREESKCSRPPCFEVKQVAECEGQNCLEAKEATGCQNAPCFELQQVAKCAGASCFEVYLLPASETGGRGLMGKFAKRSPASNSTTASKTTTSGEKTPVKLPVKLPELKQIDNCKTSPCFEIKQATKCKERLCFEAITVAKCKGAGCFEIRKL